MSSLYETVFAETRGNVFESSVGTLLVDRAPLDAFEETINRICIVVLHCQVFSTRHITVYIYISTNNIVGTFLGDLQSRGKISWSIA